MKKFGFTLAELLVSMSLIGIIVALTIPSFVMDTNNRANASKLSAIKTALENAFMSMMAAEATPDLSDTKFGNKEYPELGKYLKISSITGETHSVSIITGNKSSQVDASVLYKLKNGGEVMFYYAPVSRGEDMVQALGGSVYDSLGYVKIDVNGKAKPNIFGRDVFDFRLGNDGLLYARGSLNESILSYGNILNTWSKATGESPCTDNMKTYGCTARLVENNYKIDY